MGLIAIVEVGLLAFEIHLDVGDLTVVPVPPQSEVFLLVLFFSLLGLSCWMLGSPARCWVPLQPLRTLGKNRLRFRCLLVKPGLLCTGSEHEQHEEVHWGHGGFDAPRCGYREGIGLSVSIAVDQCRDNGG